MGSQKEKCKNSQLEIKLINIQGLTQVKTTEIEGEIKENTIFCVTETQNKYQKTHVHENVSCLHSWRDSDDKKGGGLLILYRNSTHFDCKKEESGHNDILLAKCKYKTLEFVIILIYMATNDKMRNIAIKQQAERIFRKEADNPLLILGDFNAHTGFLGPQKCDENGRTVLSWLETFDLVLLNADPSCQGQTTWSRGDQKSSIDFVIVNKKLYRNFTLMHIDEDKSNFDLSDHHMITAHFSIPHGKIETPDTDNISYLKITDRTKEVFKQKLEEYLERRPNNRIEDINIQMKHISDISMKSTFKKKVDNSGKLVDPPWLTTNIKQEISKRREINKKARKASPGNTETLATMYKKQKVKVQMLVKDAIKKHEEIVSEKIMNDRNRSKKVWQHINTMINKPVQKRQNTKLYKDSTEVTEEDIPTELETKWKSIYQKHVNEVPTRWSKEEQELYTRSHNSKKTDSQQFTIGPEARQATVPIALREHFDTASN